MRVLVTGGAGFAGSHTVDRLLHEGHEVVVVDDFSTGARHNVNSEAHVVEADIRASLDNPFRSFHPEVVVHMAAQVSVPKSVIDPVTDNAINVGGTINVVETAARAGARKVIAMSSAAVYGNPVSLPLTEESATEPLSPYGLSKLAAERYVQLLAQTHGIAYTILRPANLYGPRQTTDGEGAVIPALLNCFLAGEDPVIHGDGSQTRDFLYVADFASAIGQALVRGDDEILHVSSGTAVSISELWRAMVEIMGWRRSPRYGPSRPGDIQHSWMVNDRARSQLGWAPSTSLQEGLAKTLAWTYQAQAAASGRHLKGGNTALRL